MRELMEHYVRHMPHAASLGDRRRVLRRWAFMALIGVGGSGGCGGGDGPRGPDAIAFHQRDSVGIRIAESSEHVLETVLPWVVDTVPSLQLGQVGGESRAQFHRIRGMAGLPDGGIVVADGGSQELRWFDRFGEYLLRAGGAGEGPGEFIDLRLVPQFNGDSLLVFDGRPNRFTWVAMDGSGYRRVPPPNGSRELTAGAVRAARGSSVLFRTASAACLGEDHCVAPLFIRWVNPVEGTADTIAEFRRQTASTTNLRGVSYLISDPFEPIGLATVGPKGPLVGSGARFELRQFDDAGRPGGIIRVLADERQVGDEALEREIQGYVERGFDSNVIREVFARMDLARAFPAFRELMVDRVGWLWAELFRVDAADPSMWLVFDPEGRAHGVVELPRDLEIHEIGEDYVLGRWIDDLGVEYVRRYALSRSRD